MLAVKKLITAFTTVAIMTSAFAMPCSAARIEAIKSTTVIDNGFDLNQGREWEDITNYYASYDEITFRTIAGEPVVLSIDGDDLHVEAASNINVLLSVRDDSRNVVGTSNGNGSQTVTPNPVRVNEVYMVQVKYMSQGITSNYTEIALTKKANGELTFVTSTCYDFNVERCSEWWTDEQSLQECLMPQNDAECDAPTVIAKANELTAGCTNDWEKTFAIYNYLVSECAYDYVLLDDDHYGYQDDATALIRRQIMICEGFGNTFTALCRAAGVPAAVSFGIGGSVDEFLLSDTYIGDEGCNHAWACVCLDGVWYSVDATWDNSNKFQGSSRETGHIIHGNPSYDWYLVPLEVFSMTHKICDADTIHGRPETGSAGTNATYEITRDGTITIYGSGELVLPYGCNGFRTVVFDENCTITSIGQNCFNDCDIIERVILPDTVTTICNGAFVTCEDLEYVYIPDGVTSIGRSAFDTCDELAYVYVPDSCTDIDTWAFDLCPRAIISVPSGVDLQLDDYYCEPYMVIYR
ncbi:MAG: leucine-rich repeat protein [Saccharofermentans sp.]|nr:leucine-rich repeat protein [Saccharofermentans sp.]